MRYLVILCDGAADRPCPELGGKTPLEAAHKPLIDSLARRSVCGTVLNVPEGMVPESDTANLAVLSYEPEIYSKGRSPLEALSMGIDLRDDMTAFRCNLVTLSEDAENYADRTMVDNSAGEISTAEADELIKCVQSELGKGGLDFHTGISYRHCLVWQNAPEIRDFARPHDIIGRRIGGYLPPEPFLSMYEKSYEILKDHPVNRLRRERGQLPANSIWLWSPGKRPSLPPFSERWGLDGAVISAVDLIKGIGICAGMASVDVPGATGTWQTDYEGKAKAAIRQFVSGREFVYIHLEGPDECGHQADTVHKVKCIEDIDSRLLSPIYEYLAESGESFRIMILPDHPTPVSLRTHSSEPVPFMIYMSDRENEGAASFCEQDCERTGLYLPRGEKLLGLLTDKNPV